MTILTLEIKNSEIVSDYFKKVNDKINNAFFVSHGQRVPNIATGKVVKLESYPTDTYIINMRYVIPNFMPYIAVILGIPILFLTSWEFTWWLLFPIFFLLLAFFWSSHFILLVTKRALRKLGYRYSIKHINKDECIIRLYNKLTNIATI